MSTGFLLEDDSEQLCCVHALPFVVAHLLFALDCPGTTLSIHVSISRFAVPSAAQRKPTLSLRKDTMPTGTSNRRCLSSHSINNTQRVHVGIWDILGL